MGQTIDTSAGGGEYTWPITVTEATGKNIAGCQIQVALGNSADPGPWQAPDVDTPQADQAVRVVQMLVDDTFAPSTRYLWVKITDNPETVIRRLDEPLTIT